MAKKNTVNDLSNASTAFITSLQQRPELQPYIEHAQKFSSSVEKKLSIHDCLQDLDLNLETIRDRAFFGLQIKRMITADPFTQDVEKTFSQLQDILGKDIVVSIDSRKKLDPHCKSELDYSSAIDHYKKWLLHILFLLVFFHPTSDFSYNADFIKKYFYFIHQILAGKTISKVKMRRGPKIDEDIITELSPHTNVLIHTHRSVPHWLYLTVADQDLDGYVPSAYVKIVQ